MARAAAKIKPKADEIEVFDFEQRSPEWYEVRRGIPTASRFSTIMASGKDGEDSITRQKLLYRLAGEIISGETDETFRNEAMDRGIAMEPLIRDGYQKGTFFPLSQPGFVKRTAHDPLATEPLIVGCSPDSFVGDDGVLEIKSMAPHLLIPVLLKGAGGLPARHRAQCLGSLWVTGRQWCDLVIGYAGMPSAKFRIMRDEASILEIRRAVEVFAYDLRQLVTQIRSMGR